MTLKNNLLLITAFLGMAFSSNSFAMLINDSYAEEPPAQEKNIDKFTIQNNQIRPDFKTLFFSQKQREKIDKQREAFLNPPSPKFEEDIAKVSPKLSDTKAKKKRIYIPPKVAISAVVIKPDGSTIIRVNNKYNQSPSKHIILEKDNVSSNGVPITVNGKTKIVPVGQTLLTRKNKLVDTYKLKAQERKAVMPKTEQKAVKKRLEEVKILNSSPIE
jgi:hypothetical protein